MHFSNQPGIDSARKRHFEAQKKKKNEIQPKPHLLSQVQAKSPTSYSSPRNFMFQKQTKDTPNKWEQSRKDLVKKKMVRLTSQDILEETHSPKNEEGFKMEF